MWTGVRRATPGHKVGDRHETRWGESRRTKQPERESGATPWHHLASTRNPRPSYGAPAGQWARHGQHDRHERAHTLQEGLVPRGLVPRAPRPGGRVGARLSRGGDLEPNNIMKIVE